MFELVQIYSRAHFRFRKEVSFDHELVSDSYNTMMGLLSYMSDPANYADLPG